MRSEKWEAGDAIEIILPMKVWQYTSMDDANKIAIMYGPLVLAGQLGKENFPKEDIVDDHLSLMNYPGIEVPALITEEADVSNHVIQKEPLKFEITEIVESARMPLLLKPFYALHHERYTIYWEKLTPMEYSIKCKVANSSKGYLETCISYTIQPGQQQSEIEHDYRGEYTISGYLSELDKSYRETKSGDAFVSYTLEVREDRENLSYSRTADRE